VLTWLLLAVNAAVFLFELSLGSQLEPFIRRWGLVPSDVADSPTVWITLLTSTFLHAGWLHLVSNMLYLGVFGLPVERRLGAARFAVIYFGSGIAGGVAYVLAQSASSEPALGASGAVAGVIAAHLVAFPNSTLGSLAPVLFLRVVGSTPVVLLLIIWLVAQLLSGLTSLTTSTSIAWWAHLGGFVSGLTLATMLRGGRLTRTKY
jgi:membrane associated rhomboid family serine protease